MKKLFSTLLTAGMLCLSLTAFANHDPSDKYEAMCQSTGGYAAVKQSPEYFQINKKYMLVQLFGHCGEEPNILEIEKASLLDKPVNGATEVHNVTFWRSPEKDKPYWEMVFSKDYFTTADGKVIESKLGPSESKTMYLKITQEHIQDMTIHEFVAAKPGARLKPSALGSVYCKSSGIEGSNVMLEAAYMDYQKAMSK